MKRLIATALLSASALGLAAEPVRFDWFEYTGRDDISAAPLPAGHFRNPILAGFYPDPAICRVGEDYYLINSTFSYFPGIPVFHSRDLVNWKQLGHVIDRPSQMSFTGLRITRGLFAPTIKYHNGVFYVVCTLVDGGGNFLVTATDPAGPWSDPQWLPFDGIDPSLFFDDDGRAWMLNNGNPPDNKPLYEGHRAIWIQEFDVAKRELVGPRSIVVNGGVDLSKKPVWIEGPHLFKKDGWYYICCAEGGTSTNHSQVILRSKSPTGPFVPWEKNPILTQRDLDGNAPHAVTATGHANLVEGPDGHWWAVFLACRPFQNGYQATGRETFLLPVEWTADGWPLILPPGVRVPHVVPAPQTAARSPAPVPLSGNFTWRDDFESGSAQLDPLWLMARTPAETWWNLAAPKGQLSLAPRADTLAGLGNPAFLGRRVQHAKFDASTLLSTPAEAGVAAGLALFQNEKQHYFFGVRRAAEGLEVFVELADGGQPAKLASAVVPQAERLELRVRGDELTGGFAYREPEGEWRALVAEADFTPITTNAAGGGIHFTGAVVGPHVRRER